MEETDGQEGVSWHWAVLTWGWGVIGRQKLFLPFSVHLGASLVAQMVKTLSAMQETWVLSLSGRSPGEGNGNPLQYSCLEKSLDSRSLVGYSPWWQSWTGLSDFHFLFNASLLLLLLFFFLNSVLELPHWIPGLYTKILLSVNYCKNWWHVRGWQYKTLILPYCWLMTKLVWQKILQ